MDLPGFGTATDHCRDVKSFYTCSEGHIRVPIRDSCQRVECPLCWSEWASKAGHRVSDRLRGVRSWFYHNRPGEYRSVKRIRHFVFSPPAGLFSDDDGLESVKRRWRCFSEAHIPLKSGVVAYHPYRIRDDVEKRLAAYLRARGEASKSQREEYEDGGYWALVRADVLGLGGVEHYAEFSPHFHVLASGALPPSDVFHRSTDGWVYVNLGDRHLKISIDSRTGSIIDEISSSMKYILSHAGVEKTETGRYRQSYWYLGYASQKNSHLQRSESGKPIVRLIIDSVLRCPECGRVLYRAYETVDYDSCGPGYRVDPDRRVVVLVEEASIRRKYRAYEVVCDV